MGFLRWPLRILNWGSEYAERAGSLDDQATARFQVRPLEWLKSWGLWFLLLLTSGAGWMIAYLSPWVGPWGLVGWTTIGMGLAAIFILLVWLAAVVGISIRTRIRGLMVPAPPPLSSSTDSQFSSVEQESAPTGRSNQGRLDELGHRLNKLETLLRAECGDFPGLAAIDRLVSDIAEASRRTEAADRRQDEDIQSLKAHLGEFDEFVRWTGVRLESLEGLVVRSEQRRRLEEYKDKVDEISSQVRNNNDVKAVFAVGQLRQISQKIELLFEIKWIRDKLSNILELSDNDLRAGRFNENERHWILFQRQRDALVQAIAEIKQNSCVKDYETFDAFLTHR